MVTAAAVVGAAIVGAVASSKSSKKAAKAGAKGQKRAIGRIEEAGALARSDVSRIIPQAQRSSLLGAQAASDIFRRSAPIQQQQLSAGNLGAQRTTGRGFRQAQQALLGLPVEQFSTVSVPFEQDPFGATSENLFATLGSQITQQQEEAKKIESDRAAAAALGARGRKPLTSKQKRRKKGKSIGRKIISLGF